MRNDHDLIAWLIFAAAALLLGVLAVVAGVYSVGLPLVLAGVGLGAWSLLRHRRLAE